MIFGLEFVAIMPNKKLSEFIKDISLENINNVINKLKPASEANGEIEISIPKFSFMYDLNLEEDLKQLGINDAFDIDKANFSNMTTNINGLYVSDALHKANIDLTENGVKAAAATVIVMMEKSMAIEREKPEKIIIDKPFLYLIRDKKTGDIWFIGTLYEPNEWEKEKLEYQPK